MHVAQGLYSLVSNINVFSKEHSCIKVFSIELLPSVCFHTKYEILFKLMDKFAHLFLYYQAKINKSFSFNLLR